MCMEGIEGEVEVNGFCNNRRTMRPNGQDRLEYPVRPANVLLTVGKETWLGKGLGNAQKAA